MDDPVGFGAAVLVPIFGMLFLFGFPIAAWVLFRLLAHRERLEMIRNGITPPPGGMMGKGNRGFDVGPVPVVASRRSQRDCGDPRYLLRKGITLTFIGFALTIGLSFIGFSDGGGWRLGPWLLGGLIPLFIGLAQVTTAFLTDPDLFAMVLGRRAAFGPVQNGNSFGQTMPPPSAAAPPPQYDTSYTYRPGGTQELRPPTPPPERKS